MSLSTWHENPHTPLPGPPDGLNGDSGEIWDIIRTVDGRSAERTRLSEERLLAHIFNLYKMVAGSTIAIAVVVAVLTKT